MSSVLGIVLECLKLSHYSLSFIVIERTKQQRTIVVYVHSIAVFAKTNRKAVEGQRPFGYSGRAAVFWPGVYFDAVCRFDTFAVNRLAVFKPMDCLFTHPHHPVLAPV